MPFESNSKLGVFEYIKLCNEFVSAKKDIKNKFNYLLATFKNDYYDKINLEKVFWLIKYIYSNYIHKKDKARNKYPYLF